ncbi:MAG: chemotaxis protein CheW [Nitrospirota bacterium]|nr:chemotaxis protein CheW [Nitrospirota bacterium]
MSLRGHLKSTNVLVETGSFLIVRLGRMYLALPADGVRGVLTPEETGHEQAVTAAGSLYQLVDLTHLFSVVADLSGLEVRTVLYSNGHSHGAIRVEQVVGLTDVERKNCFPLPPQFRCDERRWFGGMMLYEDLLVLIVNPAWMLGELAEVVSLGASETSQLVTAGPLTVGGSC